MRKEEVLAAREQSVRSGNPEKIDTKPRDDTSRLCPHSSLRTTDLEDQQGNRYGNHTYLKSLVQKSYPPNMNH